MWWIRVRPATIVLGCWRPAVGPFFSQNRAWKRAGGGLAIQAKRRKKSDGGDAKKVDFEFWSLLISVAQTRRPSSSSTCKPNRRAWSELVGPACRVARALAADLTLLPAKPWPCLQNLPFAGWKWRLFKCACRSVEEATFLLSPVANLTAAVA